MNLPNTNRVLLKTGLAIFLALATGLGLRSIVTDVIRLTGDVARLNDSQYRNKYHHWYRRMHVVWNDVPIDSVPMIAENIGAIDCPLPFLSYYLAPKPVYDALFLDNMNEAGIVYDTLTLDCTDVENIVVVRRRFYPPAESK